MARWLEFRETDPVGKTRRWDVVTKQGGHTIGWIGWYPSFRGYSYFSDEETVYERVCLRDIAAFLEDRTREHKEAAAAARKGE